MSSQRSREGGGRVKGSTGDGVDHEEPERDHQAREEPADDAVGDQVVDGPLHEGILLTGCLEAISRGVPR